MVKASVLLLVAIVAFTHLPNVSGDWFSDLGKKIKGGFDDAGESMKTGFDDAGKTMKKGFEDLGEGMEKGAQDMLKAIMDKIVIPVLEHLVNSEFIDKIVKTAVTMALHKTLPPGEKFDELRKLALDTAQKAVDEFKAWLRDEIIKNWKSKGLSQMISEVKDKLQGLEGTIIQRAEAEIKTKLEKEAANDAGRAECRGVVMTVSVLLMGAGIVM